MTGKHKLAIAAAALCFTLTACGTAPKGIIGGADGSTTIIISEENDSEMTYERIDQKTAYELMKTEDCIILDVRTEEEYADSHIPGAICIPNESIGAMRPENLPDLDQLILVYCRSGRRSMAAAQKLAYLGYTNIREFGGIMLWPYEVE